ncbi:MAG: Na+/H+ antiporter NhaC [Deltaproteobacteria bacterium]|nr:Na+/H+ antiporter NhaC [Deltaproteobacteria bacterium]
MSPRPPTLFEALIPVVATALLLLLGIGRWGAPVPVLLALASAVPALLAARLGWRWRELEEGMVQGMALALPAAVILLVVGMTIGAWAQAGTLGAMVVYGLGILSPAWFLPATVALTGGVALAIGSSWTTAATVGVALLGIGQALGFDPGVVAGAIVSGAYFGDKMSPLSDTTNLAPSIAGAQLFEHIRAMIATTVPAFVLAVVVMGVVGLFGGGGDYAPEDLASLERSLRAAQHISPWLLLPPVGVLALALLRVPAVPALLLATLLGAGLAVVVQGVDASAVLTALYQGNTLESSDPRVVELLGRGGMSAMLDTIALVLAATAFGGLMERGGFMGVILEAILARVRGPAGLITATLISAVGVNVLLAEQYLAIVLPGRMFRDAFPRMGLRPRMLSRTLEDAGTVTSVLVPWNSCGAFMAATLGVSTWAYAPWAVLNWSIPLIAVAYAWTGLFIHREEP